MITNPKVKISDKIAGIDSIEVFLNNDYCVKFNHDDLADYNLFINNSGTSIVIKTKDGNIGFYSNVSVSIVGQDNPFLESLFTMEVPDGDEMSKRTLDGLTQ